MTTPSGVLALVADPVLRVEVDRVAAAAGLPTVHGDQRAAPSPGSWIGAAAVVLDVGAARRCLTAGLRRRPHLMVVCDAPPGADDWQSAISVGAQQVLTLPGDGGPLVRALVEAADAVSQPDGRAGGVIAVVAGRGGAGASLFSVALSLSAGSALLVDADPWSGGIDLLLGSEGQPGLRWPDMSLKGGRLSYAAIRDALPRHRGVSVLSGGRVACDPPPDALTAVLDAGRRGGVTVVCDLPRRATDAVHAALDAADLVVVVASSDVRSCAATSAAAPMLSAVNPNVGLVVRGPAPGGLRAPEIAEIVGLPLLAAMRPQPRLADLLEHGGLRTPRRSPLAVAARRVLEVLNQHPAAALP
ncbi:MAG: septum site-determining protein Ssd [Mycobacterium sp.]